MKLCQDAEASRRKRYLFGPVPSRRLGFSLGVDVVPFKFCPLDCVYCQLGRTTTKTIQRGDYCDISEVLSQVRARLALVDRIDHITLSGSGEPTLYLHLGRLISEIKNITDVPVAVLTNGVLLYDADVRTDCARADVVLPSLDAGDEETFQTVNRPCLGLTLERVVEGLCKFRDEFTGRLWLEVFLIEGFNTDIKQVSKMAKLIERIRPDKIQLNTAVRPPAETVVKRADPAVLTRIAARFGPKCEVVADVLATVDRISACGASHGEVSSPATAGMRELVLSILKRRPCTVDEVCLGLGLSRAEAIEFIRLLKRQGLIDSQKRGGKVFFMAH